ncbi:MAG: bifunctional phosphoribosyl-AMP cyclohydrolase/phosphoribosyl-ATP diphosphatase HisIE [Lachnospiraceae bacterium]|nr:bifunctional phosphoribosyl-AMP cyclohydrolase/phosphoribosyl-ATP diphosphatase HisIE [Lachnospiraceae bacterium]
MSKKFVACIYLSEKKAVKGLHDPAILSTDPVSLAMSYADAEADALVIFDLSYNDATHEDAILMMKQIAESISIPVYGAGNIKRMEDVKKILYAGCKKAILNLNKQSSFDILEEVSQKFGKEKIGASFMNTEQVTYHANDLEKYADELFCLNEHEIKNVMSVISMPMVVMLPEISLDKVLSLLENSKISGISGALINDNLKELDSLKEIAAQRGIDVHIFKPQMPFSEFKLGPDGLVPVVVQDYQSGQVLMVAYMNEEAYNKTCRTGKMTYYSRSRKELWVKGLTSGHFQYIRSLSVDCDNDTLLAKVKQIGAACHTGNYSCFYRDLIPMEEENVENPLTVFENVTNIIKDRKLHPKEGSYTNYLFDKGIDKILKKLGEEATEIVIAAKNPNPEEIKYEISDFLYHMMVLMVEKGVTWEEITSDLAKR